MTDAQTEARAIAAQAWNCDEWPEWLHKIVDETNEVADRLDMSVEQAHAYAVLVALAAKDAELDGAVFLKDAAEAALRKREVEINKLHTQLAEAKEELNVLRANQIAHVEVRARLTDQLAEKEAENARLQNEWDNCDEMLQATRVSLAEALSRTGAVKVSREEAEKLCARLEYDSSWDKCGSGYYSMKRQLSALEPAAPEGRQEAVAWYIEWRFKPTGPDIKRAGGGSKVLWDQAASPEKAAAEAARLEGIETVDWVRCTPLYTRPSEQAVTEAMRRIRDYADKPHADRYVIRNMAEDALKAAMEAGTTRCSAFARSPAAPSKHREGRMGKREQLLDIMEEAAKGETKATLRDRIAELEAENARLRKKNEYLEDRNEECEHWRIHWKTKAFESLSRTGVVKVDHHRLNMEISKWATDSDLHITIGDVEALHEAILSAIEPAAPEGQQDNSFDKEFASIEASIDAGARRSSHRFSLARPSEQAVTEAALSVLEWYERDGSVGGAVEPFEALKVAMESGR